MFSSLGYCAKYFSVLVSTFCLTFGDDRSILQIYELKDIPKYKLKVGNKDSYLTEKDMHKPIMYFANLKNKEYSRESLTHTNAQPILDMNMIQALEESLEAKQDRNLIRPTYRSIDHQVSRGNRAFKPWIDTASGRKPRTHELVDKLTQLLETESNNAVSNGADSLNHLHIIEPEADVTEEPPIKIRNQILL